MNTPLIHFHDVEFSYGPEPSEAGHVVLSECNFQLHSGERLALVGSNGSGKTTLLHLIVGLLKPTAGQIEAFGKRRQHEADFHEVRRRVGLLFQDTDDQLFCPTVAEDVAFGPMNLGKPREEVRRIVADTLGSLGLAGYEQRITYRLSGGEKRLVALATTLAMQPEVLLLDEPTSGLDDQAIERLTAILNGLPQAMVLASHHREFRRRITGQTIRLRDGKLQAS